MTGKGVLVRRRPLALVLTLMLLTLGACSSGSSDKKASGTTADAKLNGGVPETVDLVSVRTLVHDTLKDKRVAFIPILYKGFALTETWGHEMERGLTMLGAKFEVHDANFNTDKMVQIIDGLINEHVDVLVLHNPDVGVLTEQIKKAHEQGIYVVVLNMIANQSGDMYIGADVPSAGRDIALRAVADCKAKNNNKVAVLDGFGPDAFSIGFQAGWEPVLKDAGFQVVSHQQDQYDQAKANQLATTILQQNKDICAFLSNWDIPAVGIGEAIDAAKLKGKVGVYSLDSSHNWCESLAAGKVTASAAYDVPGIGAGAVVAIQHLLELKNKPGSQRTVDYVPHVVIDNTNYKQYNTACYTGS
jgi:ribose transport system substrate-binding protein